MEVKSEKPGVAPCKNCDHRTAECHGACALYLSWNERNKAFREDLATYKAIDNATSKYKYVNVIRRKDHA